MSGKGKSGCRRGQDGLAGPPPRRPSSWPAPACRAPAHSFASSSAIFGRIGHACGVRITSRPSVSGSFAATSRRLGVAFRRRRRRSRRPGCRGSRRGRTRVETFCIVAGRASPARRRLEQRVGGQDAGAAGVGEDRQLRPVRPRLPGRGPPPCRRSREIVSTRSTPQRRNAASSTSSLPASDPVCEAAALAAASVRPALITMIGFCSATSRAAERNARASPTDSM